MMSSIRSKDTKPEKIIRSGLHRRGFRFRLHDTRLPGKPDIVLPKFNAVIFVHGCFWHGHDCKLFKWPKTRKGFWREKILSNQTRDEKCISLLLSKGWRVMIVWECSVKGRKEQVIDELVGECAAWIRSKGTRFETGKMWK